MSSARQTSSALLISTIQILLRCTTPFSYGIPEAERSAILPAFPNSIWKSFQLPESEQINERQWGGTEPTKALKLEVSSLRSTRNNPARTIAAFNHLDSTGLLESNHKSMMQSKDSVLKIVIRLHHGNFHADIFEIIMREMPIVHGRFFVIAKKVKDSLEFPLQGRLPFKHVARKPLAHDVP